MNCGRIATIFGDGGQTRDFIEVSDIARANLAAIEYVSEAGRDLSSTDDIAFNVASGKSTSLEIYHLLAKLSHCQDAPIHVEERQGVVYSNWLEVEEERSVLGFAPEIPLHDGLSRFATDSWDRRLSR